MYKKLHLLPLVIACIHGTAITLSAQITSDTPPINIKKRRQDMKAPGGLYFTTEAYKNEVLKQMLSQVNETARSMQLQETLPISQTNLVNIVIGSPRLAKITEEVGAIGTSNYEYSFSSGRKLSIVMSTKFDSENARDELKSRYLWPVARLDTNAACKEAERQLTYFGVDLTKVRQDCTREVWWWVPDEADQKHFVPLYFFSWKKPGLEGPVVSMELLVPTSQLGKLFVGPSEYILRNPVIITNEADLLRPKQ